MKVAISLDYWTARHLLDVVRRAPRATIRERLAMKSLCDKLEYAQHRVKRAAEDDEFGGAYFPEEFQKIIADDLQKSRVKEEQ